MRIKDVMSATGLTEKAIRLYMKSGLIHPQIDSGIYRNSYTFTDEDVWELKEIAILRKAGFSILEISLMKETPEQLPELLEQKLLSLELEITEKKKIKEALSKLEADEFGSLSAVANSLERAVANKKIASEKFAAKYIYLAVTIFMILFFFGYVYRKGGLVSLKMIAGFLCIVCGIISGIMAMRYAFCTEYAKKQPQKGIGTIISMVEEHGFDVSFARAGSHAAGTKETGMGGIWQFVFMLWNEIRPDCYFPVVLYENERGIKCSATLRYGSFKNTWTKGEQIEISWNDTSKKYVYPLHSEWIKTKVYFYGFIAGISFCLWILLLL